MHYGHMTDSTNLIRLVQQIQPTEIYNLAAQSHVAVSFESPECIASADAIGVLRLLKAVRILGMENKTRFYQASMPELYGLVQEIPQNTALSALALWRSQALQLLDHGELSRSLRHVCQQRHPVQSRELNPRRDRRHPQDHAWRCPHVVGLKDTLYLGNLEAKPDWGHAKDCVEGMHKILQADRADDFVLATGEMHSVREIVELSFAQVGRRIVWRGEGVEETGV